MHAIIFAVVTFLNAWPGSWSCVSTESDHAYPLRFPMEATAYGKWVKFDGVTPGYGGKPAWPFVMLVTYDHDAKKWFIDSYGPGGKFILSTSSAALDAPRQTWTNIYPVNPEQGPGTIVQSATTWDTYDEWTARGKRVTLHNACKKS